MRRGLYVFFHDFPRNISTTEVSLEHFGKFYVVAKRISVKGEFFFIVTPDQIAPTLDLWQHELCRALQDRRAFVHVRFLDIGDLIPWENLLPISSRDDESITA